MGLSPKPPHAPCRVHGCPEPNSEITILLPLQGGSQEGDGDLPEQYNYPLSMMPSFVSKKLFY